MLSAEKARRVYFVCPELYEAYRAQQGGAGKNGRHRKTGHRSLGFFGRGGLGLDSLVGGEPEAIWLNLAFEILLVSSDPLTVNLVGDLRAAQVGCGCLGRNLQGQWIRVRQVSG